MASYVVTGANRGLGLALVQNLASLPSSQVSQVFATSRKDSSDLDELVRKSSGRIVLVKLEVSDEASIKQAAREIEAKLDGKGLDVLFNNAGVCKWAFEGVRTMDDLDESFKTNVFGVHWVTRALLPLLKKGEQKKIVNFSTTLASITEAHKSAGLPCPAYKISKAAMNSLTRQYALDYEKEGFNIFALTPGWLKTELGGGDAAPLTADQGAKATLDFVSKAGPEVNGTFPTVFVHGMENAEPYPYDGKSAAW